MCRQKTHKIIVSKGSEYTHAISEEGKVIDSLIRYIENKTAEVSNRSLLNTIQ